MYEISHSRTFLFYLKIVFFNVNKNTCSEIVKYTFQPNKEKIANSSEECIKMRLNCFCILRI